MNEQHITDALMAWYKTNARELPWRNERTPYRTWVSEIMLQQTQVATVIPYFERFVKALPNVHALAQASEDTVYKLFEGLGYYTRAKRLSQGADYIVRHFDKTIPSTYDALISIPGIGPYTAAAISSMAFGRVEPAVDGNIIRIISRLYRLPIFAQGEASKKTVRTLVFRIMPKDAPGDFNEALMDLGSAICLPTKPLCLSCPLVNFCIARQENVVDDFPQKSIKKKNPKLSYTIAILRYEKLIYVRRRPSHGLLANLYEFCSFEGHLEKSDLIEAIDNKLSCYGLNVATIRKLENAAHVFSHVTWHMHGFDVKLTAKKAVNQLYDSNTNEGFADFAKLDSLAFPRAIKTYVDYLNDSQLNDQKCP